jgi:hypothetical protein
MMYGILSDTVLAIGAVLIIMLVVDTWYLDETENGND